jgi:hypothetical protein
MEITSPKFRLFKMIESRRLLDRRPTEEKVLFFFKDKESFDSYTSDFSRVRKATTATHRDFSRTPKMLAFVLFLAVGEEGKALLHEVSFSGKPVRERRQKTCGR